MKKEDFLPFFWSFLLLILQQRLSQHFNNLYGRLCKYVLHLLCSFFLSILLKQRRRMRVATVYVKESGIYLPQQND